MWKKFLFSSSLFFFFSTAPVFAVTITTSNIPTSIGIDPFTISVLVTGPNPGTNYLRVDLYKDGTTNYFGETNNGSDWHSDSTGTNYFPITIDSSGTASAQLTARLGNPSNNDYPGPGDYKLKVRRYTSSGNSADDTQTAANINIGYTFPSPTPLSPTSTPNPSPTSTATPAPTAIPTVTPKPTVIPTINMVVPTIGPQEFVNSQETSRGNMINLNESPPPTDTPAVLGISDSKSNPIIPMLIIGVGAIGLLISLILLFIHSRRSATDSGPTL